MLVLPCAFHLPSRTSIGVPEISFSTDAATASGRLRTEICTS